MSVYEDIIKVQRQTATSNFYLSARKLRHFNVRKHQPFFKALNRNPNSNNRLSMNKAKTLDLTHIKP